MQMRRVRAGGTTSSPKHDKYLIRRNGNCQARLIVSHIIWREVANLDIAFDLSLSHSCLSQPAHALICLLFFSLQSLCDSRHSAHLIQYKQKATVQSLLQYHINKRRCVIEISLSCLFMPGVPHRSVLRPFFFPLCCVLHPLQLLFIYIFFPCL